MRSIISDVIRLILLLLICQVELCAQSLNGIASEKKGFEINGNIKGLKDGTKVFMRLFYSSGFYNTINDSAYVKNGNFKIKGIVPDGPRNYMLLFDSDPHGIHLHIDNNETIDIYSPDIKKIKQQFVEHELDYISINGSKTMDGALVVNPLISFYKGEMGTIKELVKKVKDSIGFNGDLLTGIFKVRDIINKGIYHTLFDDSSMVWPDIKAGRLIFFDAFYSSSNHADFWVNAYNNLDMKEKNSFLGKRMKENITLCVGQPFPDFSLPSLNNKIFSLKDIVSKSKVTIVHFWASNSYSRENYQHELSSLYKKYHVKGLNIVGISADNTKTWHKYLTEHPDQYPWYNVSDGQGYMEGSIIQDVYKEGGRRLPNTTNYLLDNEGRIISYDPIGSELQWHLWKIFGE